MGVALRVRAGLVVAALALGGVSCSAPGPNAERTARPSQVGTPTTTPGQVSAPVMKLLVVVEENHSASEMQNGMPYTFGLAQRYGFASEFTAIAHPSLPNYIAVAGGDQHGIADDSGPAEHPISGSSVFGEAIAAGKTAAVYVDGMSDNCAAQDGGDDYAVKHNPWVYFADERSQCQEFDVPLENLDAAVTAGELPSAGMVIPNLCNDAHNCSLATADSWFRSEMTRIFAGADWKSGHLAVVLTADEDDRSQGNRVLTVVIHPSQQGNVVDTPLNHYSLCRLFSEVTGATPLGQARTAPSMAEAFGLPLDAHAGS